MALAASPSLGGPPLPPGFPGAPSAFTSLPPSPRLSTLRILSPGPGAHSEALTSRRVHGEAGEPGTGAGRGKARRGRRGSRPGRGEAGGARTGATPPGRARPRLPTLTWSAGCAWLALAPGVGCGSCFMAVIAGGPRWRSLPRGHFRLGDRHLAAFACHGRPSLPELAEGKAAATGWGGE